MSLKIAKIHNQLSILRAAHWQGIIFQTKSHFKKFLQKIPKGVRVETLQSYPSVINTGSQIEIWKIPKPRRHHYSAATFNLPEFIKNGDNTTEGVPELLVQKPFQYLCIL